MLLEKNQVLREKKEKPRQRIFFFFIPLEYYKIFFEIITMENMSCVLNVLRNLDAINEAEKSKFHH